MKYTLLAIIVACVVIFIASGCSVPYPASKRAFMPNFLDPQYKEFKKLSQKEIGRVLYARPLTETEKSNLKDGFERRIDRYAITSKENMFVGIECVSSKERIVYIYIREFGYYGGWNKWTFNLFLLPNTVRRSYYAIDRVKIKNSHIIQNKKIIGDLIKDVPRFYIVVETPLDKPKFNSYVGRRYSYDIEIKSSLDELKYLEDLRRNYDYFKDQNDL